MAEIMDSSYVEIFWNKSELPLGCYTTLYPKYELNSDEVVLKIKKEIKEEKEKEEPVGPVDTGILNGEVKMTVKKKTKKQNREHKKLAKSSQKEKTIEEKEKKKLRKSESAKIPKELAENGTNLIVDDFCVKKERLYKFIRTYFLQQEGRGYLKTISIV